jgi:S-adenosylmethionine:tRNA-ribosyltransferase-isomerase (queuine synthetase)
VVSKVGKVVRVGVQWTPSHLTLAELLERVGHTPLPPYMRRAAVPSDRCGPSPLQTNPRAFIQSVH